MMTRRDIEVLRTVCTHAHTIEIARRTALERGPEMKRCALIGGLLIAASTVGGTAKESVSIRVSPAVAIAPADLTVQTTVEPDERNRLVEIVADSDAFYRSSAIPLEGDRAPKTTTVTLHGVPAGEYHMTAALIGERGQTKALARTMVMVVASH